MIAVPLGAATVDDALRAVRALGSHRYVAGRLHLVHALALEPVAAAAGEPLSEACAWAREVLASAAVDPASRDEALWRRSTEVEVAAVLEAYWAPGPRSAATRRALADRLAALELDAADVGAPFDEALEADMHPVLVDAGWELVPLAGLDPERHRGAIGAFGELLAFESARFEEETALPPPVSLLELPAMGPVELLRGAGDDGRLAAPLVVWAEGHEVYLDYVLRGVRRAARLPEEIA